MLGEEQNGVSPKFDLIPLALGGQGTMVAMNPISVEAIFEN